MVGGFNAFRDDEYEEINDKCNDFRSPVEKEYVDTHVTYAELEENEEDLNKLRRWFEMVSARDVLGATNWQAGPRRLRRV